MTDSDSAGFKIRNYLKGSITDGDIKSIYIRYFLEKRNARRNLLKVNSAIEGIDKETIISAFEKSGVVFSENVPKDKIVRLDLFEDGLVGGENSVALKTLLLP